jgi:hypothetical protein
MKRGGDSVCRRNHAIYEPMTRCSARCVRMETLFVNYAVVVFFSCLNKEQFVHTGIK